LLSPCSTSQEVVKDSRSGVQTSEPELPTRLLFGDCEAERREGLQDLGRLTPRVDVDDATAGLVAHGRALERRDAFMGDGPWAVAAGDQLLAVYEAVDAHHVKPAVVLTAP